jgi:hypothetical protein
MYDGLPPEYAYVRLFQSDGAQWRQVANNWFYPLTPSEFTYTLGGLATGTYRLVVRAAYRSADYEEYYLDATNILSATDIAVTAGSTTPNINLVMGDQPYTGSVSGQVRGAEGPLGGIRVDLYQDSGGWNGWWRLVYATTAADGRYTIGGLRDGNYRIRFVDPNGVLASLYYDGKPDFASANTIAIAGQNQVGGIDGVLAGAGAIAGRVSLSGGGYAGGLEVIAYRSTGGGWEALGRTATDATGNYRIGGLPPGNYRVYFADRTNTHRPEYYRDALTLDTAADVTVNSDETTGAIDATLELPAPPAITVSSATGSVTSDPATGLVTVMTTASRRSDTTITRAVACASGVTPANVQLQYNGAAYPMAPAAPGFFQVTLPAASLATGDLAVTWQCSEASQQEPVGRIVLYDPSGKITDQMTGQGITGASVVLYRVPNWLPDTPTEQRNCRTIDSRGGPDWNSLPPADINLGVLMNPAVDANAMAPAVNPQMTDDQGSYGWDVAQGCYYVVVSAQGYRTRVSPVVGVPPAVTDLHLALMPDVAPTAMDDAATTAEDSAVTIAVLDNDQDLNGDALAVVAVGATPAGTAASNGVAVTFTPAPNFNGAAVFTYTVGDGNFTADAKVTVTVTPVNDPPAAADDTANAVAGVALSIPVLANDSDVDGDSLQVAVATGPAHGTATAGGDGKIVYTAAAGYAGADQFSYTVTDPGGLTGTAVVKLTVTNPAPPPVAYAAITIIHDSQPDAVRNFNYYGPYGMFRLDDANPDDDDKVARTITYDKVLPGAHTFTADLPFRWSLGSIDCEPAARCTIDPAARMAVVTVQGGDAVTVTFTSQQNGSLLVHSYWDKRADGQRQKGDPMLKDWWGELYDLTLGQGPGTVTASDFTNGNGKWNLVDLTPGHDYKVCQKPQDGWSNMQPGATAADARGWPCYTFTLQPAQAAEVWFGYAKPGTWTNAEPGGQAGAAAAGIVIRDGYLDAEQDAMYTAEEYVDADANLPEESDNSEDVFRLFLPRVQDE